MSVPAASVDLATWADALEELITTLPEPRVIDRVAVVGETASTQDTARSMAGGVPGLLVVAERQTAGRGRLGRAWIDTAGRSLAMTFALDAGRYDGAHASLAAGVAACLAAERVGARGLGLEWPNDVVERATARKLAGVLIERSDRLLLVGVGVNVSQAPGDWPEEIAARAASLAMLGVEATRLGLARRLLESLASSLALSPGDLAAEWTARDTLVGSRRTFRVGRLEHSGLVESIDPASRIVVRTDAGVRERLPAASATLVRPGATEIR